MGGLSSEHTRFRFPQCSKGLCIFCCQKWQEPYRCCIYYLQHNSFAMVPQDILQFINKLYCPKWHQCAERINLTENDICCTWYIGQALLVFKQLLDGGENGIQCCVLSQETKSKCEKPEDEFSLFKRRQSCERAWHLADTMSGHFLVFPPLQTIQSKWAITLIIIIIIIGRGYCISFPGLY